MFPVSCGAKVGERGDASSVTTFLTIISREWQNRHLLPYSLPQMTIVCCKTWPLGRNVMSHYVETCYDPAMATARMRFALNPALAAFRSRQNDPAFLELFLIHFSSLGV